MIFLILIIIIMQNDLDLLLLFKHFNEYNFLW